MIENQGWGVHYIPLETLRQFRADLMRAREVSGQTTQALFDAYLQPIVIIYQPIVSPLAPIPGNQVFRARKCQDAQPFSDVRDLLAPPSPSGRAQGQHATQILYAASSMQTCLAEIRVKPGDLVNVVHLNYPESQNGKFWFVGQLSEVHRSHQPSRYLADSLQVSRPNYLKPAVKSCLVYADSLFHEVFAVLSHERDGYALGRLLLEAINSKHAGLFGVVYRSALDAPGMSFAFFGDALNRLTPGIVNLLKITAVDEYGCVSFEIVKNSNARGSLSLEW